MLKVEGSNPSTYILKFGLLKFSNSLCLDKNNKLGILVALLDLNDWTLRAIQSSFMVYKWTTAMKLLFEYFIDPQGSQVWGGVQGNCSWSCHLAKALTGCQGLAVSALQDRGVPPEH